MLTFLICGGRDFKDRKLLERTLNVQTIGAVVHGNAKGADRMAGEWAKERGIPVITVDANWDFYSYSAGSIRNGWMLKFIKVDYVLAFPGGKGTANMVAKAKAASVRVLEICDKPITSFQGDEYGFLSNFWHVEIMLDGLPYPSVEHAYVAAKSLDTDFRRKVREASSAAEAKKLGRKVELRRGWDNLRLKAMERLLRRKFEHHYLWKKLQATAPRELVEGNSWGDQFWGVYKGAGDNHLGKLLMKIRDES